MKAIQNEKRKQAKTKGEETQKDRNEQHEPSNPEANPGFVNG